MQMISGKKPRQHVSADLAQTKFEQPVHTGCIESS